MAICFVHFGARLGAALSIRFGTQEQWYRPSDHAIYYVPWYRQASFMISARSRYWNRVRRQASISMSSSHSLVGVQNSLIVTPPSSHIYSHELIHCVLTH